MKKLLFLLVAICGTTLSAKSQGITPAITLTTEGLWNSTTGVANWVNLLNVDYTIGLWRDGSLDLDLLAVANLRMEQGKGGVADNLHIFSAIEDSPSTLALMTFGVGQRLLNDHLYLFAGIRNLGKDYFTTPWNSIFTASMNGLFPSIATTFAVADAPNAAMALHAEWHPSKGWYTKLSLYDGVASQRWDELFRLNIRRDGVFAIGEVGFSGGGKGLWGNYNIGASYGYAPTVAELMEGGHSKSSRASMWFLAEQPIFRRSNGGELCVILHGAWAPQSDCDTYGSLAFVCSHLAFEGDYVGLLASRSLYRGGRETQVEVTYSYPYRYGTIQPAVHRVHSTLGNYTIAVVKLIVEI
jgi:hypothetical protein